MYETQDRDGGPRIVHVCRRYRDWLRPRTLKKPPTRKRGRSLAVSRKAMDANEYNLTTGKGGTWEIKSDSVDLAPHAGHTGDGYRRGFHAKMHGMKEDPKKKLKNTA